MRSQTRCSTTSITQLPPNAEIDFFNELTKTSVWVFQDQQTLGVLRGDITLAAQSPSRFPFIWLLTQDSKAVAFTRLLFAMRPWYSQPNRGSLTELQVAAVGDPVAVSRAYALKTLLDDADHERVRAAGRPLWVRTRVPWLARLWGDGLSSPSESPSTRTSSNGLAPIPRVCWPRARQIAAKQPIEKDSEAQRLMDLITDEARQKNVGHYLMEQLLSQASPGPGRGRPDPEFPPRRCRQGHDAIRLHGSAVDRWVSRSGPAGLFTVT